MYKLNTYAKHELNQQYETKQIKTSNKERRERGT